MDDLLSRLDHAEEVADRHPLAGILVDEELPLHRHDDVAGEGFEILPYLVEEVGSRDGWGVEEEKQGQQGGDATQQGKPPGAGDTLSRRERVAEGRVRG
jgi:hypothetical protein